MPTTAWLRAYVREFAHTCASSRIRARVLPLGSEAGVQMQLGGRLETPPSRGVVRWEQVESRFSAKVGAYFVTQDVPAQKKATVSLAQTGETVLATQPVESLGPVWTMISFLTALALVFLYLNACFNLAGPILTALLSALPVGIVGTCAMGGFVEQGRGRTPQRLRGRITVNPRVRTAFNDSTFSRAEKLYGEVLLLLATPTETRRDARLRHDLLKQCNTLLADAFRIEAHRRKVRALTEDGEALRRVEIEGTRLRQRRDAETDAIARRSLEESLVLWEERAAVLHSSEKMLARLNAHDEVICQALLLAKAALTRIEATPVSLATPDVEGLRQTVRRVLNQTRAVEEAVAELTER